MESPELHLFDAFGIELEYMIVDRDSLDVCPLADRLIERAGGSANADVERGRIAWSNELVLHVIELKTNGPSTTLRGLAPLFQENVRYVNGLLREWNAMLLPTAMHPWMKPDRETKLWPHEYTEVYQAFDRIFSCQGHGWSNLQSMHINLPFQGDDEFGALHGAIRFLLPLMPALTASSPYVEAKPTGLMDSRLEMYRQNCKRVPSVTGRVIPEPVFTAGGYESHILQPMYADIAPLDPLGLLQEEFLNARGAIARFDRGAIEIRVLDLQECPQADLGVAALISTVLRAMVEGRFMPGDSLRSWSVDDLEPIFHATLRDADQARVANAAYLRALDITEENMTAGAIWRTLFSKVRPALSDDEAQAIEVILNEGPLARRIVRAAGPAPSKQRLVEVYRRLSVCLEEGVLFHG